MGVVTVDGRAVEPEDFAPQDYTIPLGVNAGCVGRVINRMWRNVAAYVTLQHDKACSAAMQGVREWPPLLPITQADYLVAFSRGRVSREQAKERRAVIQSKWVAGQTPSESAACLRDSWAVEQRHIACLRRQLATISAELEHAEERLRELQQRIDIAEEPEHVAH
ncbi:hypothetical protein MFM001_37390 [Mycobacterium sp. MFM001]|uniref:hypothetical protein n=1 Tax=Mycobacterium sp. MFM001 TaxID=2049453 RepID=UPI000DA51253|nr:hypothetical protein [Mycobacterium sp. MFM001]GBE67277.1 hypothetical protein MFM001_37390 [Mycobacterium sp. MFM001]